MVRLLALSLLGLSLPALAVPVTDFETVDGDGRLIPIPEVAEWLPIDVSGADRIVNGSTTTDFANVVSLLSVQGNYGGQFCSGTQISNTWVLTAAHCVEAAEQYLDQGATLYIGVGPNAYQANGYFTVVQTEIHPQYDPNNIRNDIGLLRVSQNITGTGGPAVLNDEAITTAWRGTDLVYVGFGITGDNQQDSGIKRTTRAPISNVYTSVVETYDPNTNLCSGDSGGAGFEETADGLELAGVNSYVYPSCNGGAAGAVRVDYYIDWIRGFEPNILTDWTTNPGGGGGDTTPEDPQDSDPVAEDSAWPDPERPPEDAYAGSIGAMGGCSVTGGSALGSVWLVGLGALALRRRR